MLLTFKLVKKRSIGRQNADIEEVVLAENKGTIQYIGQIQFSVIRARLFIVAAGNRKENDLACDVLGSLDSAWHAKGMVVLNALMAQNVTAL